MYLLKLNFPIHRQHLHHLCQRRPHNLNLRQPSFSVTLTSRDKRLQLFSYFAIPLCSVTKYAEISKAFSATPVSIEVDMERENEDFEEYLAEGGEVYQKTLRLVECSMFAAVSALVFLLSNSLAVEKYFACFFALPIVLSTMRWGIGGGRKSMVATTVLLFVLSGPVKAVTYLLLHGLLGLAMGTLWKLQTTWTLSVFLCTIVRSIGALGNVVIASYLIRENILALITINVHALVTYILSGLGIVAVPSMNSIYFIFGFLLLLNCGAFVLLLHVLCAVFLKRLGMKASLRLPKWVQSAI